MLSSFASSHLADAIAPPLIASLEYDGHSYDVSCHVEFDGIEYVGRLAFADSAVGDPMVLDRSAIPGRTHDDVLSLARGFTHGELAQRCRRALGEKRRFFKLRHTTDEILHRIRYLNQVAVAVRDGLVDTEGAAMEIELVQRQLHFFVEQLAADAGVEG